MNTGMKISAALTCLAAMFTSVEFATSCMLPAASAQGSDTKSIYNAEDPIISTVYGEAVEMSQPVVHGCQACRSSPEVVVHGCQSCQTCEAALPEPQKVCLHCELKTKKVEVDKTRFKIEQKEVCVPAVRLPWKKCCPPKKSRVRTVNVLKKEKYKGEKCEYKWSVHEPEEYKEPEAVEPVKAYQPEQNTTEANSIYPDPVAESTGGLELSDPTNAMGEIPRPPLEK
jgi:hypothetical protein